MSKEDITTTTSSSSASISSVAKVYPHVQPRIDPEWYQADIPFAYEGPLTTEAVESDWFDATRKIYSNDESKDAKKNFLLHTRNLFERRKLGVSRQVGDEPPLVWKKDSISIPLESDEAAIEFLAKYDYDLSKAKFFLACILSGGRDVIHARRIRQHLAKIPSASIQQRLETVFMSPGASWMHGTYSNYNGSGEFFNDTSDDEGLLFLPDFGPSDDEGGNIMHPCSNNGPTNVHKYEVNVIKRTDESTSGVLSKRFDISKCPLSPARTNGAGSSLGNEKPQRDRASTDKNMMKKRWSQIGKNISTLVSSINSSYGGASRCSLDTVHEYLSSALSALPMPSDIVLGMDLYESLNNDIPKVVDGYIMCKEWVGEVYDALCPLPLASNDLIPCDFASLKKLLLEGEGLPFRCVFEENQLKRVLKELSELVLQSKLVLGAAATSATALGGDLFDNHISLDSVCNTDVNRSRSAKGSGKSSKKNISAKEKDDIRLMNLLDSDMVSFNEDKIDLHDLNNILIAFSKYPCHIVNLPDNFTCEWEGAAAARSSDTPTYTKCPSCFSQLASCTDGKTMASCWSDLILYSIQNEQGEGQKCETINYPPLKSSSDVDTLQLLYFGACELNNQIDQIISMATMSRHKKYSSIKPPSLSSVIDTFLACASYPVKLFGMPDLQRIISVAVAWNEEVSEACKPGAPLISLNRLEILISKGEKLSIDFSKELEALREKRGAGKSWLEKFRKSMSGTNRLSRDSNGTECNGKLDLQSMKKLIEEGGQLYEDRKSKELGRAMNVVDDAEDMINRVKGIISGGSVSSLAGEVPIDNEVEEKCDEGEENDIRDLDMLRELLADTESMPVAMEEVQLLRAHIDTVEWAERARPILRMDKSVSSGKNDAENHDNSSPKRHRVSTLIKLQKDLMKTRTSMSAEMKRQFQAIKFKLPEEAKLQRVITMIEKFQAKVRKRFATCGSGPDDLLNRNSTLRPSVTLSALRQMVRDLDNILSVVDLDMDNERYHLTFHINAAEEWLRQHHDTLVKLGIKVTSLNPTTIAAPDAMDRSQGESDDDDDTQERMNADSNVPLMDGESCESTADATKLKCLGNIDDMDAATLIDYNVLYGLVDSSAKNVLSYFPELVAARRRLEDVDAWLQELHEHLPTGKAFDEMTTIDITTTELEDMIFTGFEHRIDLLEEMKRVRGWIQQAHEWEVNAQVAFRDILTKVDDSIKEFHTVLTRGHGSKEKASYSFRIPFLEGIESSLEEFTQVFPLLSEEIHCCLKLPGGDIEVATSPSLLVEACQPIIQLRSFLSDSVTELMNKRRREIGGIVLSCSSGCQFCSGKSSDSHVNLGISLSFFGNVLHWLEQVENLLTLSTSQSAKGEENWGDISDEIVQSALDDVTSFDSLKNMQESFDVFYQGTILHSSTPTEYFYFSSAPNISSDVENNNDDFAKSDNDKIKSGITSLETDESAMVLEEELEASHLENSPRRIRSPRSGKKRNSSEVVDDDSGSSHSKRRTAKKKRDDSVNINNDVPFEKHGTRRSKKSSNCSDDGKGEESLFAASSSPVATSIHSLFKAYKYPSYSPLTTIYSSRHVTLRNRFSAYSLPPPLLHLVDLWVRMLKLLLVRKEEAVLFIGVADDIVKKQLLEKSYKGVRISQVIKSSRSSSDALYRPQWQTLSISPTYSDMVFNLMIWGTKRNVALRTRRIIDQRFGQSNLWKQVAQVYTSSVISNLVVSTPCSSYVVKPVSLPLEVSDEDHSDPFIPLLKPLREAATSFCASVDCNSNCEPGDELIPLCNHQHLFQNNIIPKLSLEEMQMFIQCAESGGGKLEPGVDSELGEDDQNGSGEKASPLRLLRELIMLPQPLLFRCPELIQKLKENVRKTKAWIERFQQLQEAQQLQAAGASSEEILQNAGTKKSGGKQEANTVNVNELCDMLICEAQGDMSSIKYNGIDLSVYLEQIMQVTQVYCLCRLPYHGFMVGCDQCDDWLHGPCIGLSKAQADRTEKYTCLRCAFKTSANQGFQNIAGIVSLWMSPEDAVKHLETKRYRVSKKVSKEDAELNQLLAALPIAKKKLKELRDGKTVNHQAVVCEDTSNSNSDISATVSSDVNSVEVWENKVSKIEEDIEAARAKLNKALSDEVDIKKFYSLDIQGRLAWNQWMVLVRDMLWMHSAPSTSDTTTLDRIPIQPNILHAIQRAQELEIIDFPDVVSIFTSFRWVSFCYLVVNLLRGPPTVKQIDSLLSLSKRLKIGYLDEKLMKSFAGLMNRCRNWKNKFRKFLSTSEITQIQSDSQLIDKVYFLDENKAKAFYEESTLCLSVRTRLRDQLRDALHAHNVAKDDDSSDDLKEKRVKQGAKEVSSRSRGAQKFSAKDVINNKAGNANSNLVKFVLPAFRNSKTEGVGYYSSDEDDSENEEEGREKYSFLSDLDKSVYCYISPSQRKLNPIPTHQLSAPVAQAMIFPPRLTPSSSPPSKSYHSNFRHPHLPSGSSTSSISMKSIRSNVTERRVMPTSSSISVAPSCRPSAKKNLHVSKESTIRVQSNSLLDKVSTKKTVVKKTDASSNEVVVTQEMLQQSLLEVSQIMSSDENASHELTQDSSFHKATASETAATTSKTNAPSSNNSSGEKSSKPYKVKKDKKDKLPFLDKEKKPRPKKEKDSVVRGELKKSIIKAATEENKKRQKAADEARALLESINTGKSDSGKEEENGDVVSPFVPKTVADALKMGANFVEKKRQQGVEALKNSISASITAKKRKQDEEPSTDTSATSFTDMALNFFSNGTGLTGPESTTSLDDCSSNDNCVTNEPSFKKSRQSDEKIDQEVDDDGENMDHS